MRRVEVRWRTSGVARRHQSLHAHERLILDICIGVRHKLHDLGLGAELLDVASCATSARCRLRRGKSSQTHCLALTAYLM